MRVIVWGINYAPEFTGIAPHTVALCEFLDCRGDNVQMVTGFPYYPSWEKRQEDRGRIYRTEQINGVLVHRCWQFVPKRVSSLKRILHEASFVLTSTIRLLFTGRADVYLIISPPLLLGGAARIVGAIKRAPFVFHVQDMQPDAALGLGMLKPKGLIRLLYGLESFAYRHATGVSGITPGMLESFTAKGVPRSKLIYLPNTIALNEGGTRPERGEFRARHGFGREDFLVIYAGNLGVKQGLEVLLETAPLLRDSRIRIVICGDGAQREFLAQRVRDTHLPNVTLLPLQVGRDYQALLIDADICLITQQVGAGNSFFPSKLLGILAESKPVVTVAAPECELALSLRQGNFGLNVPPGRPQDLADFLQDLAGDARRLIEYGRAGRRYVEQFDRTAILEHFAKEIEALSKC